MRLNVNAPCMEWRRELLLWFCHPGGKGAVFQACPLIATYLGPLPLLAHPKEYQCDPLFFLTILRWLIPSIRLHNALHNSSSLSRERDYGCIGER